MNEYRGKSAKNYTQANSKYLILNPIIDQYIPRAKSNGILLDVGCGNGYYCQKVSKKGYRYWGIDKSPDMISLAKKEHSNGRFFTLSATSFNQTIKNKFDVILLNFVLPVLKSKKDICIALENCKQALKKSGIIVIGHIHPCFDGYMQKWLFKRKDIQTNFKGYFKSGEKYTVKTIFNNKPFFFHDHHYQLSDYIDCIVKNDLKIIKYDECKPSKKTIKEKDFYNQRLKYPSYQVFVLKR